MNSLRIVCAANKYYGGLLLIGARHWDDLMRNQFRRLPVNQFTAGEFQQGFVDNYGKFLTRTEAWKIAEAAGQILYRCGGDTADGGTLYSENLY